MTSVREKRNHPTRSSFRPPSDNQIVGRLPPTVRLTFPLQTIPAHPLPLYLVVPYTFAFRLLQSSSRFCHALAEQ